MFLQTASNWVDLLHVEGILNAAHIKYLLKCCLLSRETHRVWNFVI